MAFWTKIFGRTSGTEQPINGNGVNGYHHTNGSPVAIPEEVFTAKEPPTNGQKEEPISNNIDLLFRFMDRNHEEHGYNHALMNPDTTHLEQNLEALRNEFHRTIRKVKKFYEDSIREIDFHIDSRGRSGMVDTVEELKMKRSIAVSHVEKIQQIEDDAQKNQGDSQGIIISYTRGFKNGLAAISHHNIINRKF